MQLFPPLFQYLRQKKTRDEIREMVEAFGKGARRAKEAGLDGVELYGANGYLITQFLSSGINDRTDEYGGSLKNRARFVLEIIEEVRKQVGDDFHFQSKISAVEYNNGLFPWEKRGNNLEDLIKVCQWMEEGGIDAIHISIDDLFSRSMNPLHRLFVCVWNRISRQFTK